MPSKNYQSYRSLPYKPGQKTPFKISRSKIELFMQCKRCFWLDTRLKISRPSSAPFRLNEAVDELFKREFDDYRLKGEPHPIIKDNQIKAIPYASEKLNDWRNTFVGISYLHQPTGLLVFGGVDDVWVNPEGELIVVDYKATAKDKEVNIDANWQISYKRQVEIYQWLLRQNDYKVNDTAYFVYTNGRLDSDGFHDKLEFKTKLIPYIGSDGWIEDVLVNIKSCLESDKMPEVGDDIMGGPCSYCSYAKARTSLTLDAIKRSK